MYFYCVTGNSTSLDCISLEPLDQKLGFCFSKKGLMFNYFSREWLETEAHQWKTGSPRLATNSTKIHLFQQRLFKALKFLCHF